MMESILGMLIGAGLFIGGFSLHDVNYRQDYRGTNVILHSEGKEYLINGSSFANPDRENLAYLMGPVGAAIFALSAKHAWNQREKRRAAVSMHLDQSFQRLRTRLGQDRSSNAGASDFRLPYLSKAVKPIPFPSLSASGTLDLHVAPATSALILSDRDAKRTFVQNPNIWRLTP